MLYRRPLHRRFFRIFRAFRVFAAALLTAFACHGNGLLRSARTRISYLGTRIGFLSPHVNKLARVVKELPSRRSELGRRLRVLEKVPPWAAVLVLAVANLPESAFTRIFVSERLFVHFDLQLIQNAECS